MTSIQLPGKNRIHPKKPIFANNRGAALIYLISIILIMSVLGSAMLNLYSTSTLSQVSTNHMDRAYFMAESGAGYAFPLVKVDIESNGTYDDSHGIHNQTFILEGGDGNSDEEGRFHILVDDSDPDFTLLTCVGTITVGVSTDVETKIVYRMAKTGPPVVLSDPVQYFSQGP